MRTLRPILTRVPLMDYIIKLEIAITTQMPPRVSCINWHEFIVGKLFSWYQMQITLVIKFPTRRYLYSLLRVWLNDRTLRDKHLCFCVIQQMCYHLATKTTCFLKQFSLFQPAKMFLILIKNILQQIFVMSNVL